MDRLRVATIWFGGCSGCHMSFLDLDEFLIDLAEKIEIVFSPVVDVKEYPDNVDVCLIEGALCNEENVEWLKKIRQRTKAIGAHGAIIAGIAIGVLADVWIKGIHITTIGDTVVIVIGIGIVADTIVVRID